MTTLISPSISPPPPPPEAEALVRVGVEVTGLGLGLGLPVRPSPNQDAEVLAAGKVVARRRRRPRGTPHWRGGGRGCASISASIVSAWPVGVSHEVEAYCELQKAK